MKEVLSLYITIMTFVAVATFTILLSSSSYLSCHNTMLSVCISLECSVASFIHQNIAGDCPQDLHFCSPRDRFCPGCVVPVGYASCPTSF